MEDGDVAHTAPNAEPMVAALDADDTDSLDSRSSCPAAANNFSGNGPASRRRLRLVRDPEQFESRGPHRSNDDPFVGKQSGPNSARQYFAGSHQKAAMVFHVRSSWAAAGQATTCLLLEWLIVVTSGVSEPVTLFGREMPVSVAARVGWEALRHTMRS